MYIRHICSPTAEGLEKEVNYYCEHTKEKVVGIDTNFDGTMFNAYIKINNE